VPVRSLADIVQLMILLLQGTDVMYLKLLTTDFVVLNSTEAITDLPEKRSNIYCDRVSPSVKHTRWLGSLTNLVGGQPDMPMLEL
jgi:hypothetical protein